jgi:hypothetical protein
VAIVRSRGVLGVFEIFNEITVCTCKVNQDIAERRE